MAVYLVKIKPVFRAGSAVAVSAHHTGKRLTSRGALGRSSYLAGERLVDNAGLAVDYRSKAEGIEHTQVVLPGGGTMDREKLWNAVDNHPVRKDAIRPTVARSMIVATPHELSLQERIDLNVRMAKWIAERYEVAVDIGMHKHTKKELENGSTEKNVHCHFLISQRRISPDGKLGTVQRDFEQINCKRSNPPRETAASEIRKQWERFANESLERGGHKERISCRSSKSKHPKLTPHHELSDRRADLISRHQIISDRISQIQEATRYVLYTPTTGFIGGIGAWQRDAAKMFALSWQSADRAMMRRKRAQQRIRTRPKTEQEALELRTLGRARYRIERSIRSVDAKLLSMGNHAEISI